MFVTLLQVVVHLLKLVWCHFPVLSCNVLLIVGLNARKEWMNEWMNVYLYTAHITKCPKAVYNSIWVRSDVSSKESPVVCFSMWMPNDCNYCLRANLKLCNCSDYCSFGSWRFNWREEFMLIFAAMFLWYCYLVGDIITLRCGFSLASIDCWYNAYLSVWVFFILQVILWTYFMFKVFAGKEHVLIRNLKFYRMGFI